MGKVLKFKKIKLSDKHRCKGLCAHGFHKWEVVSENQFDVRKGKLITASRCTRCGATKNKSG